MQYIDKQLSMPVEVETWVKKNKPKGWNLSQDYREGYETLREQLRKEQHGLCCYCCQTLQTHVTIEHLESRDSYPKLTFDYDNLLLSCQTSKQCDNAKSNQDLELTPLMTECDDEIKINLAGELTGKTDRANQAITLLNLNNAMLCNKRKSKIDMMIFTFDLTQSSLPPIDILDRETLNFILEDLGDTPEYYEFDYLLKKLQ